MKKITAAAAAMALIASQSHAQERWPRWYAGLSGGPTFLDDSDIGGASTGELDYDTTGGFGVVSLGYMPPSAFQPFSNMRLEAELGYHHSGIDGVTIGGTPVANPRGAVQMISYMGNVYYDFRNDSQWTPYLGAGAGGARVSLSKNSGLGNTGGNDNVFAYQFMGGIGYSPRSLPQTEWVLGYRYFAIQDPEFRTATTPVEIEDYNTHNVEIGGRFRF